MASFGEQFWTVTGYEDTKEEIFQIPRVRQYFQAIYRMRPGWLVLLNFKTKNNLAFLLCLLPTVPQHTARGLQYQMCA